MPPKGRKRLEVKVEAGALRSAVQESHSIFQQKHSTFRMQVIVSLGDDDRIFGGYIGGVTPVPIPNTEVKSSRADGTSRETARESRSLPDSFRPPDSCQAGFLCAQQGRVGAVKLPLRVAKRIVCALK